jgi:hypothetical protein
MEIGDGGVYIQLIHKVHTIAVATGKYCNKYNAEAVALKHAADALREHKSYATKKVVIFTKSPVVGDSTKEPAL